MSGAPPAVKLPPARRPAYHHRMGRRFPCSLALLALTACASGEDLSQSSGFNATFPATMPGSASATQGVSSTSEPTGGESGSGSSTTDMIRPDFGVLTSTGGPDLTTGPIDTTTTITTDPGTSTTTTTGPMIVCGDGIIEGGEECEGADLDGQSCISFGFTGGTLTCDANCLFDKTQCVSETCGDGAVNGGGEECDCGQQGSPCSDAQLGNVTCSQLVAPQNGNYHGGTLTCGSPQSCVFNKGGCIYCGDGVRNGPEACEGGDLGGQSCQGLGFTGGNLSCNSNCTHNTAGCFNAFCGDGVCNNGETSCSCPGDCPDDPNSCSPCECGGFSGNCACDDACIFWGDCCPNGPC